MPSRTIFTHRHFQVFSCSVIQLSRVRHWHDAGCMRTTCDAPGPAAPRACAGTGLCRTRRRSLRCSRRLLPTRSPACRSRRGRAALARRRVRHPGDQHGQVPVPYSHHAVPTVRGFPVRSLLVAAAGIPAAYAADLVRHMAGRYRPPDALRRADTLPRADPPAAMTARQPDRPGRRAECHERALPRTAATYIAGSGMLSPSRVCRTADIAKDPFVSRAPTRCSTWLGAGALFDRRRHRTGGNARPLPRAALADHDGSASLGGDGRQHVEPGGTAGGADAG